MRLVGHPLRWRLLDELGRSDRGVRELTALVARPQSLVSYHLGRLRAHALVTSRRSSADGREAYYSIDLERCGELLAAAGSALHPALLLRPPESAAKDARPVHARVLFLCTGNSARSQIAAALLGHRSHGVVQTHSAGSHPKRLHPNTVRVMDAYGIDIARQTTRHLDEYAAHRFDWVITLCDRVREVCPEFPGQPQAIHWSIPDPSAAPGTDSETYATFQRTAAALDERIRFFLPELAAAANARDVQSNAPQSHPGRRR